MITKREQIILRAIEILKLNPNGVRYSDLMRKIQQELPDMPVNTIHGTIWDLDVRLPKDIYKPSRGLFRHTSFRDTKIGEITRKEVKSTSKRRIVAKAVAIVKKNPDGIRYSELIKEAQQELPGIPVNTIHGTVWNLDAQTPKEVYKPARGLFRHITFREKEIKEEEREPPVKAKKLREEDFYRPFADWLVSEMEECTRAIPLGGNKFKDKWGTPDVIGVRKPLLSDIVRPLMEIISAEIKADSKDLITAFGQACSYRLFSHKSYIVISKNSSQDDKAKIDALCLIFGIGLIFFDSSSADDPQFEIRVRPIKYEPDMFYVNKYMKLIEKDLFT